MINENEKPIIGQFAVKVYAGLSDGDPHPIGEIFLPIRHEGSQSWGNVRWVIDTAELRNRLQEAVKSMSLEAE